MATQITPARPHNYEDEPNRGVIHSVVEEDHHEKKSMLQKVKDKAKKIKHTFAKKAHVSDSDHDPANEVHTTVIREDDDDEDSEDEPEVHGAPMYESATAHDRTGREEIPDESSVNLGQVQPSQGDKEHVPKDPTTLEACPPTLTNYPTRPSEGPQHIPMDAPLFEEDPTTLEVSPHAPTDYPSRPSGPKHIPVDGPPFKEDPTTLEAGPHASTDYPTRPSKGPHHIPMDGSPFEEDPTTLEAGPHVPTDYSTQPFEGPQHIPMDGPLFEEDPTTLEAARPSEGPQHIPSEGPQHIPVDRPPFKEDPTTLEASPHAPTDYLTRPSEEPQHIPMDGPLFEEDPTTLEAGPHASTDYLTRPSEGPQHIPVDGPPFKEDSTTLEEGPHASTDYPTRPSEGPQHIPMDAPLFEEDPTALEAGPHALTDYPTRPSEGAQHIPVDGPPFKEDPTTLEVGPHAPTDYPTRPSEGPHHIPMDGPPFEEGPHAPKEWPTSPTNYQTKVMDPTASGVNEAGVPNLDRSFQAMNLSDESNPPTGSLDQFSPESLSEKAPIIQENLHPVPDTNNESQPSEDQSHAASYISSATSALAQGAISAKNAVASKLGYGQSGSATSAPSSGGTESPESEVKVTETESGVKRSDTGVSASEFVAEKLRPGDEHKTSSEMIGDAIQKKREEPESGSVQPPVAERVSVFGGDGAGKGVVERLRGAVGSVFGMGGTSRDTPAPDSQSCDGDDEGEDRKNQVSAT